MQYPLISEYLAAIRETKDNLDKLNHLVPVLDKYGEPYRSSGAFAVVFKMKDEQTGKCYALKCFTEEQEGRAEAYRQIAEELEFVDSSYITSVKYLEKELFVDSNCEDEEFPVLLMDWIEGETMETYVAANYTDTHAMSMLCYRFCKMAAWLRSQSFAHGDIKPDNIMVRPDGTLTLVDYDGMFVPAMKGQKSPTIGTKDFSHPLRAIDDFDETIDDFALASIALSLKAISLNPSLLKTYGASDRLLFSAADYLDLSKSKTFTALQGLLADDEARTLMSMFLLASAKKDLSMCSFRLFGLQKPKEEEVWSTEVTDEDLENAVEDEFGVKYSKDWKRLLKAPPLDLEGKYSIRQGTKVIGNNAFWESRYLTGIDIPNSVTSIGSEAFYNCSSLVSITIPSSVVAITGNPFCRCDSDLYNNSKSFIYENHILFNNDKTTLIAYRSKETNYIIPDSVIRILDGAFSECRSIKSITIPYSVKNIGDYTFMHCWSLENINIPDRVTSIGKHAFYGCYSLKKIHIPNSATSIGESAFWGCSALNGIIIPNSVTCIGGNAFGQCKSLISINIPNSVASIGKHAFDSCKSLSYINIPNSVTNIGEYTFSNCESLNNIDIPDSVTSIGLGAFNGCKSLISINIPNSVTSIGKRAFDGCKSLISINIPKNITVIGENIFSDCNSLTNINIPERVTSIGNYAFSNCYSLTKIYIPNSVISIGEGAFSYCKSLTIINIPNKVKDIGDHVFSCCNSLTNINIPNSVTTIEYGAFEGCESLTNINIPNSVTTIGYWAFKDCKSLTSINIPNSVTTIEDGAFVRCINLPSNIKSDIIQRFGQIVFDELW